MTIFLFFIGQFFFFIGFPVVCFIFCFLCFIPLFLWPRFKDSKINKEWFPGSKSVLRRKPAEPQNKKTKIFKTDYNLNNILILLAQIAALVIALYLGMLGQKEWAALNRTSGLGYYFIASIFLLVAFWNKGGDESPDYLKPLPIKLEIILFLIVLAIGVFFRLYKITSLPSGNWYDEASNGLIAQEFHANTIRVYVPEGTEPAQWFYFLNLFLRVFGVTTTTLRFQAAFFGILTLVSLYFLLRIGWNQRAALIGTFLLSVSRWHVNFSRINFNAIQAPFLEATVLYFLLRGLKFNNKVSFVLAGLCLGFFLHSYLALRLFFGVIFLFILYKTLTARNFIKQNMWGLIICLVVALLISSPIIFYALTHSAQFMGRSNQVSIFNNVPKNQLLPVLWSNFKLTIYQYTVWGDGNGRHNLPTVPLLDFLSSIFCTLGLGFVCFDFIASFALLPVFGRRVFVEQRSLNFLNLCWLGIMIMPGVLTIEAPQALRTLGAAPAIFIFAVIFIDNAWKLFTKLFGATWELIFVILVLVSLIPIAAANFDIYFHRQFANWDVWRSFSTTEMAQGEYIKSLNGKYRIISDHIDHPTIKFIAGDLASSYHYFYAYQDVPVKESADKGIVYILQGYHEALIPLFKYYYPHGNLREFRDPWNELMFFGYEVEKEEVAENQGLMGQYFKNGQLVAQRTDSEINFEWRKDQLPTGNNLSVHWKGQIYCADKGNYYFGIQSTEPSVLVVDGKVLINSSGGIKMRKNSLYLIGGMHEIKLAGEAMVGGILKLYGGQAPQLLQIVPSANLCAKLTYPNGLKGLYYRGLQWKETPEFCLSAPMIQFEWVTDPIPAPWSVEWLGKIKIKKDGEYVFGLNSNRHSELKISNSELLSLEGGEKEGAIKLDRGTYPIRVKYAQEGGTSLIKLWWIAPGMSKEWVPPEVLLPEK